MHLPNNLKEALEAEILSSCEEGYGELSQSYRMPRFAIQRPHMETPLHRMAYLAARLPATYAAISAVLQEVGRRAPAMLIRSLLDLGAGPGTAMWAAAGEYDLATITLAEQDVDLISIGKRLSTYAISPSIKNARWNQMDITTLGQQVLDERCMLPPHDLVILSYAIGELSEVVIPRVIAEAWQRTQQLLVIIEPGTPQGFERIRLVRDQLIGLGAHLIAPCPHSGQCPIKGQDWCHFSQRLERSARHRQTKKGSLSYEDEKFSYIAVGRQPINLPTQRIIRHPQIHTGHVGMTVCAADGEIHSTTVSRHEGDLYRLARKAEWGSVLQEKNN